MEKKNISSKYFHIVASARKKSLTKDNGAQVFGHNELCDVAISYFNNLFQEEQHY